MAVSHGIFHFIDGDFVVETIGGQCHPRGSVRELRGLFHSHPGSSLSLKDPTAHWYEAQLLHYGLAPPKIKGTAAMRLLDELNKGTLRAPNKILKLEQVLEREWYGEDSDEEISPKPSEIEQNPASDASKSMQTSANDLNFDFSLMSLKEKGQADSTGRRLPNSAEPYIFGSASPKYKSCKRLTCQPTTAHQSNDGHLHSSGSEKIKVSQELRNVRENFLPSQFLHQDAISCSSIKEQRGSSQIGIILCLDTPRAWGAYDFGRYFEIFVLEQRPYRASDEPLPVNWRGREYGIGTMAQKDGGASWIAFLGNGEIEGCLELDGDIAFWGSRIDSATTSSPRSARSMWEEWNSYAPGMSP